MLGLWTGDAYSGRDDEIQTPELLMAGDVLRRAPSGPLVDRFLIARILLFAEGPFRMSKQIGAVTTQGKHQQQFGIQARRGDIGLYEKLISIVDCLIESNHLE